MTILGHILWHVYEFAPRVTKLDPVELKMERVTPICQKNGTVSLQLQRRYAHRSTSRGGRQTVSAATASSSSSASSLLLADRTVHNADVQFLRVRKSS